VASSCEHHNEPSVSVKGGGFDYLNDKQLLKKVSAPLSEGEL
jgi:hypothetical protein